MSTIYPKDEVQKTIEEICRQHFNAGWQATYSTNLAEWISDNSDKLHAYTTALHRFNKSDGSEPTAEFERRQDMEQEILKGIFEAVIADLNFVRENNDDLVADVVGNRIK